MESTQARHHPAGAAAWRVHVLAAAGRSAVGAGVLLPGAAVLTCAHVVRSALGLTAGNAGHATPTGAVRLAFPAALRGLDAVARVAADGWFDGPPMGDLAVLKLAEPAPQGVAAAPVDMTTPSDGAEVAVFGHPERLPAGVWARARTVAAGGPQPGWWQLDGADHVGVWIQRGFSGAGVWDTRRGRVIGVVVSVFRSGDRPQPRVAWMIPLSLLAGTPYGAAQGAAPAAGASRGAVGTTGGWDAGAPPGPIDTWAVAEALMAVTGIAVDGGKGLIALLPEHIGWGVPRDDRPRLQVFHVVRRCGDFADGPAALVRVVRQIEGDTLPVRCFVEQAKRLWPNRLGDGAGHV